MSKKVSFQHRIQGEYKETGQVTSIEQEQISTWNSLTSATSAQGDSDKTQHKLGKSCPQAVRPTAQPRFLQLRMNFLSQSVMKILFKNSFCLGTVSFQSLLCTQVWGRVTGVSHSGGPQFHDLKTCTARTTYCRQMGHSLMRLPHLVQVTMCPHSSRTQSMTASMQIRHRLSSSSS